MAGPDGRDFTCMQGDPPDYLASIDAGVDAMRFAWTDDYGFTGMYAQDESARVIDAVRTAAHNLADIGAKVETTTEVWEDFFPGSRRVPIFIPPVARPPRPAPDQWESALDTRKRNYDRFRALLADHDLLLSATTPAPAPYRRGVGRRVDHGRLEVPAAWRVCPGVYEPHPHVQLAWVSGRLGALWLCGRAADRTSAHRPSRERCQDLPGSECIPAGVPATRTPTGVLGFVPSAARAIAGRRLHHGAVGIRSCIRPVLRPANRSKMRNVRWSSATPGRLGQATSTCRVCVDGLPHHAEDDKGSRIDGESKRLCRSPRD